MRTSLWTRLMGVFLGVIVVGVIVMIASVRLSTAAQLRRRVLSDDVAQANTLATLLTGYYSQNGSWKEVEAFLASAPQAQNSPSATSGFEMGPGMMGGDGSGMMGPDMMDNWSDWMGMARTTGPLADLCQVL